jgi:hypothetical protein
MKTLQNLENVASDAAPTRRKILTILPPEESQKRLKTSRRAKI